MNADDARKRLLLAQERIMFELSAVAKDLGPGWQVSVEVDWINVTSISRSMQIPQVRLSAQVEAA